MSWSLADLYEAVAEEIRARSPRRIAVNSSTRNIADGLSWTQRSALEAALGPPLAGRLVSSEEVVIEWLSVKLPREVEIMRRAAALTEQLELEALPARLEALEAEKGELEATMSAPDFYKRPGPELAAASARLRELEAAVASAYERWEELEELASG